jgi:epimerase transport system membrane fusion protein
MSILSPQSSELPPSYTNDAPLKRLGMLIVFLVFGGLGGWAALAPIDSAALAPGVVTVESYRKTVQHLEGGIIKEILARDGDLVQKDQILIVLEDTQARAQLQILRGQYFIALATEARLLAEQRDGNAVAYPPVLVDEHQDPRAEEAIQLQNQSFKVRKISRDGEIAVLEQAIQQLNSKISGLQALKASREKLVASLRGELADHKALLEQGFVNKQRLQELERQAAQMEGEQAEYIAEIATTQMQIGETRLKILQLKKDFQTKVAEDLARVQGELFDLREKMQSLQDTVERTVIKAPENGMVMGLAVHTIGGVIKPGESLLDIVPKGEKLVIEAEVAPLDIDRVHAGLKADVRLSVFKSATTPRVEGEVISVSADRLTHERTGASYYLARVALSEGELKKLEEAKRFLVPGMPVEVLINTGQRTMLEYMMQPLTNAFAKSFIED